MVRRQRHAAGKAGEFPKVSGNDKAVGQDRSWELCDLSRLKADKLLQEYEQAKREQEALQINL